MFNYPVFPGVESHLGLQNLALPESYTGDLAPGPSRAATPQPPVMDDMWAALINDPNATGSLHGDDYPFASNEFAGPIDFENTHFPPLFSGSD